MDWCNKRVNSSVNITLDIYTHFYIYLQCTWTVSFRLLLNMFPLTACLGDYAVRFDVNAEGAKPYSHISTVEACATLCESNTDCLGFDFDRNDIPYKNARCWIHHGGRMIMKKEQNVDHFEKRYCAANIGNCFLKGSIVYCDVVVF